MIQYRPFIQINRLVILSNGIPVYDQEFHSGVNIIRGSNSSGKSTIADFIFFVLGGDLTRWKPEASKCNEVIAEVKINDAVVTLKRVVSSNARQSMWILMGSYEKAVKSAFAGWQVFNFQRSQEKESFSQVLFRLIGLPEVRSDTESNITMHQLLRLIYVDQLSPVDNLMRMEQFDTSLTRMAVRDLLLGIYDDDLHSIELYLLQKSRELGQVKQEYESTRSILGQTDQITDIDVVNKKISELSSKLSDISDEIDGIETTSDTKLEKAVKKSLDSLRIALLAKRSERAKLEDDIQHKMYDLEDSNEFILCLKNRLEAIDESITARMALGNLPLTNCPHCLSPITPPEDKSICILCHIPIDASSINSQALRMKQELAFQIKESEKMKAVKERLLEDLQLQLSSTVESEKIAHRQYDEAIGKARSSRDSHLNDLLIKKGNYEAELVFLHKQAKACEALNKLKERVGLLTHTITRLQMTVQEKKRSQQHRMHEALERIEYYTLYLLKKDLPREDTFLKGTSVLVDFAHNSFAVDDRNQFSASSIGYLKNCIHYGIFFASLDFEYFRLPRFILCDNMEDKGMEQLRSQNFQRNIVALSLECNVEHQIIFTTSMIDPELNNKALCIGPQYDEGNKSLHFPNTV